MQAPRFVHLHLHTHYSLLDGATEIGQLMNRCQALDMPAVAITDHGNMFAAIEFYRRAKDAGIKPILGMEAYLAPGHRADKEAKCVGGDHSYHLLLLAQNITGYRNMMRLASLAYREGFYYKPRIDKETLNAFNEGIICTSTCLGAELPQMLLHRDLKEARQAASTYLEIFGDQRFFIEVQDHGLKEQQQTNPALFDIADSLGVGVIASNDVHYLNADDAEAHDVLLCISTGCKVADEDRFKFPTDQFYLKSAEDMATLFPKRLDALSNTLAVADMCNVELEFGKRYAPVYRTPKDRNDADYLRDIVFEGAARKYESLTEEVRDRIDYELSVISSKGFSSYFLIVWDLVKHAREHGIPCGARGSGCSSVVSYCLDISLPDPLRYGLYFERFMDPDRDEMPDIDIDICQDSRQEIIDYVRNKYGHVAQIITFGTLKARAAVKDVARVMGVDFERATKLTTLIPAELNMTISKALEAEPELARLYREDDIVQKVIDVAKRIEGLARHAGIHAAGVVIADQPLDCFLPLYKPPGNSSQDQLVTQFDGPTVETVGLLKMDFLGLRTLTTLERARQLAERNHHIGIDLDGLDLTDQEVYRIFAEGETKGIFQFESDGMRDVIRRMRPNRIEDLIAANALFRPGPMINIDAYVARKHGEAWSTPHPLMTEVLEETFGIMVYQEQVSRLVNRLGGIELKAAFRLAKAISKKKTHMIEAMRKPFIAGCEGNGLAKETATQIFEDILRFGGYAFNKSHSTGYALVAYQTAYMKRYYPLEFMAALLTFEMGDTNKVVEYIEECKRMNILVKPPDINSSLHDFTPIYDDTPGQRKKLRFGLGAIKGLGSKAVQAIIDAREEGGPFQHIFDFCERVDLSVVNRGAIEALIKSGALDCTGAMRKALMMILDSAIEGGQRSQQDKQAGQLSLLDMSNDNETEVHYPAIPDDQQWSEAQLLAFEKEALGFFVTNHPLAHHEQLLRQFATANTKQIESMNDGQEITIGGMVTKFRTRVTKSGRNAGANMGIVTIEDMHGSIEGFVFPKELEAWRSMFVIDSILFFKCSVDRRREIPSLRISEVIALDDVHAKLTDSVLINLNSNQHAPEILNELSSVFSKFEGQVPVIIRIKTKDDMLAAVRCAPGLKVEVSKPFFTAVESIIGNSSVQLVGNRNAGSVLANN